MIHWHDCTSYRLGISSCYLMPKFDLICTAIMLECWYWLHIIRQLQQKEMLTKSFYSELPPNCVTSRLKLKHPNQIEIIFILLRFGFKRYTHGNYRLGLGHRLPSHRATTSNAFMISNVCSLLFRSYQAWSDVT